MEQVFAELEEKRFFGYEVTLASTVTIKILKVRISLYSIKDRKSDAKNKSIEFVERQHIVTQTCTENDWSYVGSGCGALNKAILLTLLVRCPKSNSL